MSSAHPDPTRRAATLADAREQLWANTRLVVIDTETCQATDGDHIVAIAAVTCRHGRTYESWSALINPGVPIDPHTVRIHGITDEHVADEAPFADYIERLLDQLAPEPDEQLVVAGHNIGFDISRLHLELSRHDEELPDLVMLDTMTLPEQVGLDLERVNLPSVLAALGLVNPAHHDVLSDALSTAQAAIGLLRRAAERGETNLPALLQGAAPGSFRTSQIRRAKSTGDPTKPLKGRRDETAVLTLPAGHVSEHGLPLPAAPDGSALDDFADLVEECVALRCSLLVDDTAATNADPDVVRKPLEKALNEALTADDPAAATTVLAALAPLLQRLDDRNKALRWCDRWADRIAAVGRCGKDDRCAACREDRACPVDVWDRWLAPAALSKPHLAKTFLPTSGEREGKGVFATWRSHGRARLADRVAWLTWSYWHEEDQPSKADKVARLAWAGGCREPRLASVYAGLLAASGTDAALKAGIDICDEVLNSRDGSTDDGWQQVVNRRQQLASRLAGVRPRTKIGPDGAPVRVRRHHPTDPQRQRRRRFSPAG